MSGNNNDINRRSILKGIGTTAALSVSFVGSSTAKVREPAEAATSDAFREFASDVSTDVDAETHEKLVGKYRDPATVEAAFRGSVEPILAELADRGYLESASLAPFEFDSVEEDVLLTPTDAADGAGVTTIEHEEGATAHLMATTRSENHRVAIYRQPELDNTYAMVQGDDGGVFFHDMGSGEVSPAEDCGWEALNCTNSWCDYGDPPYCEEYQRYCCYGPNYEDKDCNSTRYACSCRCS